MQVLLHLNTGTGTRIEIRLRCVGGKPVICQVGDDVLNGRLVAKCSVDWLDLGAEMVSRGLAIAIERESLDYVQKQQGRPLPGCRDIRWRVHRTFAGGAAANGARSS